MKLLTNLKSLNHTYPCLLPKKCACVNTTPKEIVYNNKFALALMNSPGTMLKIKFTYYRGTIALSIKYTNNKVLRDQHATKYIKRISSSEITSSLARLIHAPRTSLFHKMGNPVAHSKVFKQSTGTKTKTDDHEHEHHPVKTVKMPSLSKAFSKLRSIARPRVRIAATTTTGRKHADCNLENQDSYFIKTITSYKETSGSKKSCFRKKTPIYCVGVFDGHGQMGREVSKKAAEQMEMAVDLWLQAEEDLEEVLRNSFKEVARTLKESGMANDSGSTGSVVIVKGKEVVMGHVGDSTITLWDRKRRKTKDLIARYISMSHRPEVESERERIEKFGGVIKGDYVMQKSGKEGIAVTRTLGDGDMEKIGCISEPEIVKMELVRGQSIVVGTDGLWDDTSVSMHKVMYTIRDHRGKPKDVVDNLLALSTEKGRPFDDATIVCITS